jgi:hypothetical protein
MNRCESFGETMKETAKTHGVDRWVEEQLFEEDVRAMLRLMRPNRQERLKGWSEYRTGGEHFRVTVSWDEEFAHPGEEHVWRLPRLADVIESILVGSARNSDELTAEQEFDMYRAVLRDVGRRLDEMESCYA